MATLNNVVLNIQKSGGARRLFTFICRTKLVILAVVLAGGMSPAMADCKASVTGNGSAKNNEQLAKSRAKDDWKSNVANIPLGVNYQLWIKSKGKQLTCSRTGGVGKRVWNCAAISQPCLL